VGLLNILQALRKEMLDSSIVTMGITIYLYCTNLLASFSCSAVVSLLLHNCRRSSESPIRGVFAFSKFQVSSSKFQAFSSKFQVSAKLQCTSSFQHLLLNRVNHYSIRKSPRLLREYYALYIQSGIYPQLISLLQTTL
jgi:hypothetical protein